MEGGPFGRCLPFQGLGRLKVMSLDSNHFKYFRGILCEEGVDGEVFSMEQELDLFALCVQD